MTAERAVRGLGEPYAESLHARREGCRAACLDDEVNMVSLYGVVDDAERFTGCRGDRVPQRRMDLSRAERRKPMHRTQRDVDGMAVVVRRTAVM